MKHMMIPEHLSAGKSFLYSLLAVALERGYVPPLRLQHQLSL
jgi:hypothetical protein